MRRSPRAPGRAIARRKRERHRSEPASDSPEARTETDLARLSDRFARFAVEARAYAGPLYAALSAQIARDEDLLLAARHVRHPPVPNVFLAAVHFLLLESSRHELASFYGSLTSNPRPPADAHPAIAKVLTDFSSRLPVHWLHCENEEVRLRAIDRGRVTEDKLANKDGHGRWLEWLRES